MTYRLLVLLPAVWLAVQALAQTPNLGSDPSLLARTALGPHPGSASVAVWRGGTLHASTVQRATASGTLAQVSEDGTQGSAPLYEIGSISKVFTGLLLAQAVERGALALSDTLGMHLKGKLVFSSPAVAAITLEQLVTHRSCLPRQFGAVRGGAAVVAQLRQADRAALWAALSAQTLARSGPCEPLYSNYGMAVLAELLSELDGRPWSALVRAQITGPLGMEETLQQLGEQQGRLVAAFDGRRPAPAWDMQAFAGAGGLRSSVHDLVRFGRALAQGRAGPLGAAAERLVTPLAAYRGGQIGYAVFVDGPPERRTWSHDGLTGGFRAQLTVYPDSGEVLAVLVANWQAPLQLVMGPLAAARYPVRSVAMPLDVSRLGDYAGVFRIDPGLALVAVVHDGALYVRATGSVFRAYLPVAPDVFARPAGGAELRFIRREGLVEAVELAQSGRLLPGARTAELVPQQAVLPSGVAGTYAGYYSVARLFREPIEFEVRELDGQLVVRSSAVGSQPVFPMPGKPDRFQYESARAELQFERDDGGRVVALVLHENGQMRAVRGPAAP